MSCILIFLTEKPNNEIFEKNGQFFKVLITDGANCFNNPKLDFCFPYVIFYSSTFFVILYKFTYTYIRVICISMYVHIAFATRTKKYHFLFIGKNLIILKIHHHVQFCRWQYQIFSFLLKNQNLSKKKREIAKQSIYVLHCEN